MVLIDIEKPKNCFNCKFNNSDCWCSINSGYIDRDDFTNNLGCPMIDIDLNEDIQKAIKVSIVKEWR